MQAGRSDVIAAMANRTDLPSYGFQIEHGVTALSETWDPRVGNSQNHCMLGHIEEWFGHGLAGINPGEGQAGLPAQRHPAARGRRRRLGRGKLPLGPRADRLPLGSPRRAAGDEGDDSGQHDGDGLRPRRFARRGDRVRHARRQGRRRHAPRRRRGLRRFHGGLGRVPSSHARGRTPQAPLPDSPGRW